jgi:hypothetical protein
MRIEIKGEDDLEQALREIHRLALAYEGPMVDVFMELARVSAPVEPDEELTEDLEGDPNSSSAKGASLPSRRETKGRFEDALSMLMELAFPVNGGTEQEVRRQINQLLGADGQIASMNMLVDDRKHNLAKNLGRRPTKAQAELRDALLEFLPGQTEVDL